MKKNCLEKKEIKLKSVIKIYDSNGNGRFDCNGNGRYDNNGNGKNRT